MSVLLFLYFICNRYISIIQMKVINILKKLLSNVHVSNYVHMYIRLYESLYVRLNVLVRTSSVSSASVTVAPCVRQFLVLSYDALQFLMLFINVFPYTHILTHRCMYVDGMQISLCVLNFQFIHVH